MATVTAPCDTRPEALKPLRLRLKYVSHDEVDGAACELHTGSVIHTALAEPDVQEFESSSFWAVPARSVIHL